MEKLLIKLSTWIVILALLQMHGYKSCLEKERIALLKIKSFFISASDREYADDILNSWVDDPMSDCCTWEGIKCNAYTYRVTDLSLNRTRQIPADSDGFPVLDFLLFLHFQELQSIDLSGNDFESWRIEGLAHLKNLEALELSGNGISPATLTRLVGLPNSRNLRRLGLSFSGVTPSDPLVGRALEKLTHLEVLTLRGNEIHGPVKALGLSNLRYLKVLDLSKNHIKGYLESQGICELKNLVELNLGENFFEGRLPQCLNNLTRLKVFAISDNLLNGNLPSVLENLTSLEYLDLSNNYFGGIFSLSSLANHAKLQVFLLSTYYNLLQLKPKNWLPTAQLKALRLSNCHLNGTIPSFLLQQHDLKYLDLSNNKLVGDFPIWLLQNNTKLKGLVLGNNSFTGILQLPNFKSILIHLDISSNNFLGIIPQNIGTIHWNLRYMDISNNSFEGNIPSSIGEMKRLSIMDFSRNNFLGELPSPLFTSCFSLWFLDLSENNFYGKIFPKYMNLTLLQWLYLNNNHFNGKIEDGLLKSIALHVLDISNNKLSGHIPPWIGNFAGLEVLLMSRNYLKGSVPDELVSHEGLEILDISENSLSGSIAHSFNLLSIKHLYMQKNFLGGPIPNVLFRSTNLMTLDWSDNNFSGRIPRRINKLSDLRVLLLGRNQLQGHIPNQLCQLQSLGILDLSRNRLNGSIPSCFTDVLFWKVRNDDLYGSEIEYFGNSGVGSIGPYYNSTLYLRCDRDDHTAVKQRVKVEFVTKNRHEVYNGSSLNYMAALDFSGNELTGEIPSEIGNLPEMQALNFSHNSLSGSIPESFSNLKMIESLDLSHNKLSGQIPPQLIELTYLSTFNVSYNYLFGPTPDKGQFATFDDNNYKGNPGLCGLAINKSCNSVEEIPATTSDGREGDESAIDMESFSWSFGASFVMFILGLFAVLWINSNWRRLWFYFIETCIDWCYYWLFKCFYFIRDHYRP